MEVESGQTYAVDDDNAPPGDVIETPGKESYDAASAVMPLMNINVELITSKQEESVVDGDQALNEEYDGNLPGEDVNNKEVSEENLTDGGQTTAPSITPLMDIQLEPRSIVQFPEQNTTGLLGNWPGDIQNMQPMSGCEQMAQLNKPDGIAPHVDSRSERFLDVSEEMQQTDESDHTAKHGVEGEAGQSGVVSLMDLNCAPCRVPQPDDYSVPLIGQYPTQHHLEYDNQHPGEYVHPQMPVHAELPITGFAEPQMSGYTNPQLTDYGDPTIPGYDDTQIPEYGVPQEQYYQPPKYVVIPDTNVSDDTPTDEVGVKPLMDLQFTPKW